MGDSGGEAFKFRNRVMKYLQGNVLDLGVDDSKITPWAIGVDLSRVHDGVNIVGDVTDLYWFHNSVFDAVVSSHCLEDIKDTYKTLCEWLRVVKHEGHLILYLPHKDFYPNIGQPYANAGHQHDFVPEDIINIMAQIGGNELVYSRVYGSGPYNYEKRHEIEYSFEQVYRKI